MDKIELGHIEIHFDSEKNRSYYSTQNAFTCDCPDCLNYVDKIPMVKKLMRGLDETLRIDLNKAVGQGMDELMGHDRNDHCLIVIPYYIQGKCLIEGKELEHMQHRGPIMTDTIRVKYKLNDNLNLTIVNTSNFIKLDNAQSILTLWLEFKTELLQN